MKIRQGFVSNSSSSSFIVKFKKDFFDHDKEFEKLEPGNQILSEDKIKLLKKVGFKETYIRDPFYADFLSFDDKKIFSKKDMNFYLFFFMSCNHEDGLQFMVANNIPFRASVHYGNYLYSYEKDSKYIYVLPNIGGIMASRPMEMLKEEIEYLKERKMIPYKKIKKIEFLKHYNEKDALFTMTGKEKI